MALPASCKSSGGRVVLAGGSKRADGERADVTERGCDFVGQSEPQKIHILIGAQVLQRKNGDGSLTGGDHNGCGALLDEPKQSGQHHDRNRGKYSGDLRIGASLRAKSAGALACSRSDSMTE